MVIYAATLTFALTFRSDRALARYLHRPDITPRDDAAACAWAVLASFCEFASGDLVGLDLAGTGSGRLLDGYAERACRLARDADGLIAGVGEDGARWVHGLAGGRVLVWA